MKPIGKVGGVQFDNPGKIGEPDRPMHIRMDELLHGEELPGGPGVHPFTVARELQERDQQEHQDCCRLEPVHGRQILVGAFGGEGMPAILLAGRIQAGQLAIRIDGLQAPELPQGVGWGRDLEVVVQHREQINPGG